MASSKHRQTERFLATLEGYLLEIQSMLLKERYPGGLSQRQRLLAMEEEHELINGYSYFDNGDDRFSDASSQTGSPTKGGFDNRKVGRRLTLRETD